ncbi:vomeronasal type-2 receptor 26 [Xenopus tropicalis]|uniref:Vomeronasal type-2 receptor 26 n=1 Tax=Xenopus tropicalis TaxID=8364 RepID=A0A8J1IPW7_XENTR|nr:vomeronasal type-2 receptor 26 [Xenopus tropicalis]
MASVVRPSSLPGNLPDHPLARHLKHFNVWNYQNVLAFVFAINEINNNPDLLPNITLGFHIVDNCLNEERAISAMLDIISGGNVPTPNYRCGLSHNLVAFVDGISTRLTLLFARMFGIYKIPQLYKISFSSLDPVLSDKIQFPFFYRTVPSDDFQYLAIVTLIKYFSWTWLHKYLKNINFTNSGGEKLTIDENRRIDAKFDILNWAIYSNQTLHSIKVGSYDPQNASQGLTVSENLIRWSPAFSQTPHSACSETCLAGYRKTPKAGYPACCYDCIPCPEGQITNVTDMERCITCPITQWPNAKKDTCLDKVIIYLSYEEELGIPIAFSSIFFFFLTCLVMTVFNKYRTTPIVKANNQNLSYVLLFSLKMCFLCPLIFIGQPIKLTCMTRQTVFSITFSISLSSILAKTITVVIVFHATRPGSKLKNLMGSKVSVSIVIFCSFVQVVICACWLGISPPFPQYNMEDEVGKIIAECNEGSLIGFYCVLGYLGVLASVSFIIAFLARDLPDTFNEAKFITFSMLVFCSVWVSFIPAYMSAKGKYIVAVEIFAILASSLALLGCIFIPKCYVILVKPECNTRDFVKRGIA